MIVIKDDKITSFNIIIFAKDKANFKKMPNANEVQKVLQKLVEDTLVSYGDVGIFDPAKLAEIDQVFQGKIAEREIFLKQKLEDALVAQNLEEMEQMRAQIGSERARLEEEREDEKNRLRES